MAEKLIRPIRIEGNVAFVTLTKGHEAIIDAIDINVVAKWNWYAGVFKNTVYARRNIYSPKHITCHMHRLIMNPEPDMEVDHINGNGLDCRRSNMRTATRQENQSNQRLSSRSSSGLKGASFYPRTGQWRSQIKVNTNYISLGIFNTAEEAHAAYCEASARLHGAFGRVA